MVGKKLPSVVWAPPPAKFDLPEDEVHVWRASLNYGPEALRRFEGTLAPDEVSRAARFVFPRDRDLFIAARGILRDLIGAYLKEPAAMPTFDYGRCGKPALRAERDHPPLRFNLSHSHGMALYAFAEAREVGIDIEFIRPGFGGMEVAERFFSASEVSDLHALPLDLRAHGFFACWTKKEAYVKACGAGLQIPLDSFDVSLTATRPEELLDPCNLIWTLQSFQPAAQFIAAVAGHGTGWQIRFFEWLA
ncbi:MAG: 4'-phosphopantetheinyl transferase family protein [Terriglobia bacterium]